MNRIETRDEYGHDQVSTFIDVPDGVVKVSTCRSFFSRAVLKWLLCVEHNYEAVGLRLFASKVERDAAAAQKIAEVTP